MPSETRRGVFERVKSIIRHDYSEGDCGLFFTPNRVGDPMEKLYEGRNGVTILICRHWSYFEVFGLTADEKEELKKYYDSLTGEEEDAEEET